MCVWLRALEITKKSWNKEAFVRYQSFYALNFLILGPQENLDRFAQKKTNSADLFMKAKQAVRAPKTKAHFILSTYFNTANMLSGYAEQQETILLKIIIFLEFFHLPTRKNSPKSIGDPDLLDANI